MGGEVGDGREGHGWRGRGAAEDLLPLRFPSAPKRYRIQWEIKAVPREVIEGYVVFCNEEGIRTSLGGPSIKEHRDKLAKMSGVDPSLILFLFCELGEQNFLNACTAYRVS